MISRLQECARQTRETLGLAWRRSPSSLVGIALLDAPVRLPSIPIVRPQGGRTEGAIRRLAGELLPLIRPVDRGTALT